MRLGPIIQVMLRVPLAALAPPLLALGLVSAPAFAGQLHVERIGLAMVAKSGGRALRVKVKDARKAEGNDANLEVVAIRAWPAGKVKAGVTLQVRVYGGVVWDDARRSPMDRRVRGALSAQDIGVGQEVILVEERSGLGGLSAGPEEKPFSGGRVEALPATEAMVKKLDILFDRRARTRFLGAPRPELLAALSDADLAPLALEALGNRGGVRAPELLDAAPTPVIHGLLEGMKIPARARFFRQSLPWAKEHPEKLEELVRLGTRFFEAPVGLALAPLALLADPGTQEGHKVLRTAQLEAVSLLESGRGSPRLADAYVPVHVAWVRRRESYEEPGKSLKALLEKTTPKARRALLRELLAEIPRGEEGMDFGLLAHLAPAVEARPDPAALELILALEPFAADVLSSQESVLERMVRMASAIVSKRPADRARLAGRIEPYLRYGLELEPETHSAYRAAVGESPEDFVPKAEARQQRSEHRLAPGERSTDLAGYRVDFDAEEGEVFSWRVKAGHHGGSGGELSAKGSWSIEGLESGRLFVLRQGKHDRAGRPRLEVTLHPAAETAPALRPEAELKPLAEAAAREARCPETGTYFHEPELGRLRFEARDPVISGCTVVVGAYTGEVTVER